MSVEHTREELRRARAALERPEVRAALAAMSEDPSTVERYLASALAGMRQKGLDRVREAEAHLRRGPTPFTVNTRLRLYEPIDLKVRRASIHRAIEEHCEVSAHAAMLLADLDAWGEVPIASDYREALEELRAGGLAEARPPLPGDPDARVRAAPMPFVAQVMEQIRALARLDVQARERSTPRKKARRA